MTCMKSIRLVAYIVYRYYSTGGKKIEVAYLQTILIFVAVLSLDLECLLDYFNLIPAGSFFDFGNDRRLVGIIKIGATIMIPGYFLLSQILKEDDLKKLHYDETTIKKGKVLLLSFFIASFMLIIIGSIIKHNR